MLDNILNLVKSQVTKVISNNQEIPKDKKQQAVQATTEAVANGFQQNLTSGNLSSLTSLFSGGNLTSSTSNPLMDNIKNIISNTLVQKVGLSPVVSSGIAATLVPTLMNTVMDKVNDPNEKDFNLQSIVGAFTGGNSNQKGGNMISSLGKLFS